MKLSQGDCLKEMRKIETGSIDLVLCDLPYGMTKAEWDHVIPFEPLWEQYLRITKENAAILLFSCQPFTTDLIMSNRRMFRYEIIWEKTQKLGFLNANRMPLRAHENICVFYRKLPTYNPQMSMAKATHRKIKQTTPDRCALYGSIKPNNYVDDGSRYPSDVIHFSNWNGALFGNVDKATKHPTQKPVPLLEYLIRTYTNEGETVLDNCMGSGSTGVASVNTNRNFIGIEIANEYYEIAKQRIDNAIQQKSK